MTQGSQLLAATLVRFFDSSGRPNEVVLSREVHGVLCLHSTKRHRIAMAKIDVSRRCKLHQFKTKMADIQRKSWDPSIKATAGNILYMCLLGNLLQS